MKKLNKSFCFYNIFQSLIKNNFSQIKIFNNKIKCFVKQQLLNILICDLTMFFKVNDYKKPKPHTNCFR